MGAISAVITYTLLDTTPPTLAQVTPVPTPTNDNTPSYTFSSSEAGTISYSGGCTSSTTSAVSGSNTVTFNTLADGTYSSCKITVTDAAGNPSSPLSVSAFTIDTAKPTLSPVHIQSNNANTAIAIVGNTVTLTFTASEAINNPTVTIAGHSATKASGSGSGPYTYTYVMTSSDTAGVVPFSISFSDLAGNAGTAVTSATDSSSVTFVKNAPVVAITAPAAGARVNGAQAVTFTDSAPNSPQCSIDNANWVSCTSGTTVLSGITGFGGLGQVAFTLYLKDTNVVGTGTDSHGLTKDTVAPVLTQITPIPNPTNDNTPSYTFSSSEAGTISYAGGCTSSTTSAVAGSNTVTFNTLVDGTYSSCTIIVTDAAGNPSTALTVPTFRVDATAPTIPSVNTAHANGAFTTGEIIDLTVTYSEPVTVTGTPVLALNSGGSANYQSGSGTSTLTFRYTVAAGQNSADLTYSSTSALTLNGGTIRDAAGNNAINTLPATTVFSNAHAIVIDTAAPSVDAGPDKATNAVFTQTGIVTDPSPSSGGLTYSWTNVSGPGTITFGTPTAISTTVTASTSGTYVLQLTAADAAGNNALDTMTLVWFASVTRGGGSFDGGAGGNNLSNKMAAAKAAANSFVDIVDSSAKLGLVYYNSDASNPASIPLPGATTSLQLVNMDGGGKNTLKSSVNSLSANTNTCIWCGLNNAVAELTSTRHRAGAARMVILLTDGNDNCIKSGNNVVCSSNYENQDQNEMVNAAVNARTNCVIVYTIGFGDIGNLDETELTNMALLTSDCNGNYGKYYYAPDAATLTSIYHHIGE